MPEEPQTTNPEGAEAVVIPMEATPPVGKAPVIKGDGTPTGDPAPQQTQEDQGAAYWQAEAEKARAKAEQFDAFSPLIGHLQRNPEHVDMLQQAINGNAVDIASAEGMAAAAGTGASEASSYDEDLARELGLEPSQVPNTSKQPVQQPQEGGMTTEEAVRYGEMRAQKKMEFQAFQEDIQSKGVPDHAIDQFVQYLRNPGGLTVYDLWAAYNNHMEATGGGIVEEAGATTSPAPPVQLVVGKPMSITSMPAGHSDRPDQHVYESDPATTERFVQNPGDI